MCWWQKAMNHHGPWCSSNASICVAKIWQRWMMLTHRAQQKQLYLFIDESIIWKTVLMTWALSNHNLWSLTCMMKFRKIKLHVMLEGDAAAFVSRDDAPHMGSGLSTPGGNRCKLRWRFGFCYIMIYYCTVNLLDWSFEKLCFFCCICLLRNIVNMETFQVITWTILCSTNIQNLEMFPTFKTPSIQNKQQTSLNQTFPGTEVPSALLGRLLPGHASKWPLRVRTGRRRWRRLHHPQAASGNQFFLWTDVKSRRIFQRIDCT